jgi:hypothetical protein
MDEQILKKLENGEELTGEDFLKIHGEAMLAAYQSEVERRKNVVRLDEVRAAKREENIKKLIEFDRQCEEHAAEHAEIFRQREAMLKESARLEGKARGRWYETFLKFSALAKQIDSDDQRVDAELRLHGAKVDAARVNLTFLPASDVFNGLVATGEFSENKPAQTSEDLRQMLDLFGQLQIARRNDNRRSDYGDIENDPPPKKAA